MINVLILEDDHHKLTAIVEALVQTGAVSHETIETARDSLTARRMIAARRYDLLVLDLAVPERLGEEINPEAGRRLLDDLFENQRLHMPGRIVGLTGYEELAGSFSNEFLARGVVLVRYEPTSDAWRPPLVMQIRQITAWKRAEASASRGYQRYLGIVCALEVEFDAIQRLPWGFREANVPGDPTVYIEGEFEQRGTRQEVVAALCPRMGISAAAITGLKLIDAFRPQILGMTGITAAVRGQANLGDVIVADECWDWGMGKWSRRGSDSVFSPGPHHLALDADLRTAAVRLSRSAEILTQIRAGWAGPKPDTMLRILVGPVASGAAVISAQEMTEQIRAQHRKLIGIEMEAYGVYSAAAEATLPRPRVIAIKAASDYADDQKDDSWQHYCAYVSAAVLRNLVESGI